MAYLNMEGPFDLTAEEIDKQITEVSPGNYALGYIKEKSEKLTVKYVGRSDVNVNDRLTKGYVGSKYKHFNFSYAKDSKEAFEKECKNYHDFGGSDKLDNEIHPDRPDGTDWECPECDHYNDDADE